MKSVFVIENGSGHVKTNQLDDDQMAMLQRALRMQETDDDMKPADREVLDRLIEMMGT